MGDVANAPAAASLDAKKSRLKRLLRQRVARGHADGAEVAALVERVERAANTEDLAEIAGPLLAVLGQPRRSWNGKERRHSPRRACWFLVRVLEDGSHGMHFIRDIGRGGFSLTLEAPLPLFPVLHCRLPLYHLGKEFTFTARVVWCQPEPPQVVGLEFVEVGEDMLEWVDSYLAS